MQLSLLDAPGETYERGHHGICHRWTECKQQAAYFGPPVAYEGCVNRLIRCAKCGMTGEESRRLTATADRA